MVNKAKCDKLISAIVAACSKLDVSYEEAEVVFNIMLETIKEVKDE